MVRITDIDRNTRTDGWDDRLIRENTEARISKFAHFAVGHRRDAFRHLRDDARVDGVNGINIRKVLVDIGANRRRENRTRDIATAARKSRDFTIFRIAKEAWINDDALEVRESTRKRIIARGIECRVTKVAR